MHEFERWPGYNEQSWQQRFVTLDARYRERGDAVIEAAYRLASEIATLQAKLARSETANELFMAENPLLLNAALRAENSRLQAKLDKALDGLEWIGKISCEEIPLEYNDSMRKVFQRNIRDYAQSILKKLRP